MNFRTLKELSERCRESGLTIGRLMLQQQAKESGREEAAEFATMKAYYGIMKEAVHNGLTRDTTSRSASPASTPSGSPPTTRAPSRASAATPDARWRTRSPSPR